MRACVPATWALLTRASSQPCHMQLPFSSSSEQSTVTCSKKKNTPSAMLLERKQVLCSSCNQNASANAFSRYHVTRHFAAKHPWSAKHVKRMDAHSEIITVISVQSPHVHDFSGVKLSNASSSTTTLKRPARGFFASNVQKRRCLHVRHADAV